MDSQMQTPQLVRIESVTSRLGGNKITLYFIVLWIVSIALEIVLATHFRGYVGDQMIFLSWMQSIQQLGLGHAYQAIQLNYPPIYPIILDVFGRIMAGLHESLQPGQLLIKLPGIAIHGFAMLLFFFVSRRVRTSWRVFVLTLFCLNPALLFDTAVWGQVDILDGILCVIAIVAVARRSALGGATFTVALFSKFQSIVIFPVMFAYVAKQSVQSKRAKYLLRYAGGALIPLAVVVILFVVQGGGLMAMINKAYIATTGEYPYLDLNAMNIWFHLFGTTPGTSDAILLLGMISFKTLGLVLLFFAVMYVVYYIWYGTLNSRETLLKAATLVSFSFYMLPTEIHERYSLMGLVFCIFVTLYDRKWALLTMGLTLTAFWNLWAVNYGRINQASDMWMVYLNCVLLIAMFVLTSKEVRHPWRRVKDPEI